ncbi:MAG: polysaccharide biosynthesis protein [Candidatus Brocadiia bacterium]|nr:MAG: polysaccharide biosynthesis protein [Candidatus Brocadiia bacterium]
MPDSDTKQTTEINQKPMGLAMPLAVMLRFRKPLIIIAHVIAFTLSLMLAFLLVNSMQLKREWLIDKFPQLLLYSITIKLIVFGFFKQYRGWWRYVGITDLISIAAASLVSTFLIVALWSVMLNTPSYIRDSRFLDKLKMVDQGVFLTDMFATILMLGGLRMGIRLYYEEFSTVDSARLKKFLIIGAGNAGEALLREIHRMQVAQYEVVGFIDDDPAKKGISIHGIPVLGTVDQLPQVCESRGIEEIAIAMPSASHSELRHVVQACQGTKVRFMTVPSITDIASGKYSVSQIRDVDINDLLGRDVVHLDLDLIEAFARDKIILVTGAGGSIGSEMCRQLCNFKPKLLLLVEQAENPLFEIERELSSKFPDTRLTAIICDITDRQRVYEIFEKYKPQVIIHAAAHKHVPLMELNPGEAIKNNIAGTSIVADAADRFGSKNFVMISTDKAVNPTSLMGSSKRIAELYIQDLNRTSETDFITVRFGNVLGSNGSVVPIFKKQIAMGGPVTVTHPEMKRYFMTIPEASQLVLQAASMGKGGEIFVLDMGEPVKIVDLASELITLSGFRPNEDIEIRFTGTRPGEKLFEELSIKGEDMLPTRHPKIGIWKNIPMDREQLRTGINGLIEVAKTQDRCLIIDKIKVLVPEYIGNNHLNNSN